MPNKFTPERLEADNRDLRARLEKAEETLNEILSGESDALFVTGAGGAQIFTLKGADQSYRTLIENMSEGALTLTPDGLVLYANRRFAEMLRTPLEKVIGSQINNWFASESRQVLQALLQKDAGDIHRKELALAAADGTQVPVYISVSRLVLDEIDSVCMVVTDLTEQKRNEAILAAEKLSNAILEQAADAIVICDATGRIIRASKQAQAFYGKNPVGQPFEHAFPLRQLDGTAFSAIGAIDTNRSLSVEARLERNGQGLDLLVSVGQLKGAREELLGSVVTLTDITERNHAENALRKSELEFRTLAEAMPQIVWITRADGWNIFFNQKWMDYTGLTLEESLGHGWNKPFHPDDQQRAWDAWQRATAEIGIYSIESRLRRADGVYRWWLVRGEPLKDAAGNILKWFGTCTDIHDLKMAELEIIRANKELRESDRRFTDMLGNVELVSMMLDREAQITYCNDYLLRLTGWKREEVIGKNWLDIFVPPELNDLKGDFFAKLLDNQPEGLHHENEILTRSGERRLIRWSNSVLRSGTGEVIGTASIGEDITERNRLELEKEQYLKFFKLSTNAMCIADPYGRFKQVNPAFANMTGYSESELLTKPFLDFVLPEDRQSTLDEMKLQMEIRPSLHFENRYVCRDGSVVRLSWTAFYDRLDETTYATADNITERKAAEAELKLFRMLIDQSSDGIEIVDPETLCFIDVNQSACRSLGYSRDEYLNLRVLDVVDISDVEAKRITQELRAHNAAIFEGDRRRKDGSRFPVEISLTLVRDEKEFVVSVVRDTTERKEAEARIAYLNRVYAVLSGINTLIVRVQDRDELFREACRIALDAGGFRMAMISIVDRSTMKIVPAASAGKDEELLTAIRGLLSSSDDAPKTMVARAIREKQAIISNDTLIDPGVLLGKQYVESGVRSMAIFPLIVADEAVGAITLYASEIEFFHEEEMKLLTELAGDIAFAIDHIEKQERLNYLAYYDVLTGLANRTLFLERLSQYMRSAVSGGHKLAMGMIDLERFKNINDSLGRTIGDALLKQVAEWITHKAGDASVLARIDADHFAFVLPEVMSDGNLAKLVENLMAAFLEHPFRLNDIVLRIGVKVGIALFPDDGTDADTLFRNAEAALKKAKAGGDRFLFYKMEMNEAVAGKLAMENQLRQAIDNEEFVLHYQPKVNLLSGKVTSAEALIRWNDPRTGLVPPGKFIPILEETGLIYEVGRWALHQAIRDYLRWRDAGLPAVRIAVNVSPLQLRNINFIDEIRQVIALDAHAAAGLELEITESLIMEDVKLSIASLQAIRTLGVTIAIDDFGTGFSSLSYLSKLPVDTLKIDRAFVIEMNTPEGLALVSTIIIVAHALKLKVVAEGVETEQQSRQLLSLNCDEMQGFLFSKPVPAEIFETRFLSSPPVG